MSKRDLMIGFLAGVGITLCVTGGAAWVMLRAYPAGGQVAPAGSFNSESGGAEVAGLKARADAEKKFAKLKRRLAEFEKRARRGESNALPSHERLNRCFLLRGAFSPTGEFHDNLPVYQPTRDRYWERIGQDPSLHPEIRRYRILWMGGKWSDWYTPGKDDFDSKTNADRSRRLMWCCFTDHAFQVEFHPDMTERCLIRRNPFVDTREKIDGLPVYRPTGDEYWARVAADPALHPEIRRYRILQPNGEWSEWYKPGQNDQETPPQGAQKLNWRRFIDHKFQVEFN